MLNSSKEKNTKKSPNYLKNGSAKYKQSMLLHIQRHSSENMSMFIKLDENQQ